MERERNALWTKRASGQFTTLINELSVGVELKQIVTLMTFKTLIGKCLSYDSIKSLFHVTRNNDFHFWYRRKFPMRHKSWIMMIFRTQRDLWKSTIGWQVSQTKVHRGRLYSDYERFLKRSLHAQLRLIPFIHRLLQIGTFFLMKSTFHFQQKAKKPSD